MQQLQPKQPCTVYFDSDPHGAHIYVDGQILSDPDTGEDLRTPTKAILYEGRRNYTISLEGYEDVSDYVDVFAGVTVNIFRNMEPGTSEEGWEEPEPQIFLTAPNTEVLSSKMLSVEGAWSDTYYTMRPILPKLQSYYQNEVEIMNETTNMNMMQEPFYPESPEIPCAFPEKPGETATQGSIVMTTYPLGGTIIMDGKTVIDLDTGDPITTPVQLVMSFGFHDLRFHLDGFFDEFAGVYITPAHISFIHKNFNVQ